MRKFVSDTQQAPVMAVIAVEGQMTRAQVTEQFQLHDTAACNIFNALSDRSWIDQRYGPLRPHAGRRPLVATPSEKFWRDYTRTLERANEVLGTDGWLYRDAVEQLRESKKHRENSRAHKLARSNYLGRTAYIGESYDLPKRSRWFKGLPGWDALITIEALR